MSREFYRILQVSHNATLAEIKASYRQLALKCHPDVTKGDKLLSEKFKLITNAYEVLSDEAKRSQYDASMGIRRSDSNYQYNYRYKKPSGNNSKTSYNVNRTAQKPPIYGFNEKEWYEGHYGASASTRDSFYRPGDYAQEYYRNLNRKYEAQQQAKIKTEKQIRDEAIEKLNRSRELRRKAKMGNTENASVQDNISQCKIF